MRVLGVDYGARRVGIALGDTETRLASPWRVLTPRSSEHLVQELLTLAREEQVERFVVGVPHPLSDPSRETDQAREIRAFIANLSRQGVEVIEEDESLSSRLACVQAEEMDEHKKRDDLAAAVILQTYLDRYGVSA